MRQIAITAAVIVILISSVSFSTTPLPGAEFDSRDRNERMPEAAVDGNAFPVDGAGEEVEELDDRVPEERFLMVVRANAPKELADEIEIVPSRKGEKLIKVAKVTLKPSPVRNISKRLYKENKEFKELWNRFVETNAGYVESLEKLNSESENCAQGNVDCHADRGVVEQPEGNDGEEGAFSEDAEAQPRYEYFGKYQAAILLRAEVLAYVAIEKARIAVKN